MLRNLGIRWQILAVLALPLLVTLSGAGVIARQSLAEVSQARGVEQISSSGAVFTRLVDALQRERATSAAAAAYDESATAALPEARLATDRAATAVRALLQGSEDLFGDQAGVAVRAALAADGVRAKLRASFDTGGTEVGTVVDGYNAILLPDAALPEALAQPLLDRVEAGHLQTTSTLLQLVDAVSRMQLAGHQLITGDLFVEQAHAALSTGRADADRLTAAFRRQATPEQIRLLDGVLQAQPKGTSVTLDDLTDQLTAADSARAGTALKAWTASTDDRLRRLTALSTRVTADAHQRASLTLAGARLRAQLVIAAAVVAVLVSLLLALVLARRITAPLRRLTDYATTLGGRLPEVVARLQTSTDVTALDLPELPETGRGEVGRLAAAFRDVNRTTVEAAREQARLRLGVAEMFINVARRNQTLLSRQLAFIDQLERTEEDPDALDNLFRLDHLATRLQRNAESLLVLAGVESGRRLRRPILLSDVVRTATSEIEHYERVSVAVERDPLVLPHLGLSAAHLIAEVLDNATTFSDPQTTVLVTLTGIPGQGMRVTVRDEGIGMTGPEVADAHQRIAAPTSAQLVGSQRLGFHVIGSLARRLDASVTLAAADGAGLLVTVDLPDVLFVPGSGVDEPSGWPAAVTPRTPIVAAHPAGTDPITADPITADPITADPIAVLSGPPPAAAPPPFPGRRSTAPADDSPPALPVLPRRRPSAEPSEPAAVGAEPAPVVVPDDEPRAANLIELDAAVPSWADLIDGSEPVDPLTSPDWIALVSDQPAVRDDAWSLPPSGQP